MAKVLWSSLTNGQVKSFNPGVDLLEFPNFAAPDLVAVVAVSATSTRFTFDGKSVTFSNLGIDQIVSRDDFDTGPRNVSFPSFGRLIVGDNSTLKNDGAANVINGTSSDDHLLGLGGDDTIVGGFGNDFVEGGAGNDTLYGDDDFFPDSFSSDTVSYATATGDVAVSLAVTTAQDTGGGGTDTLSGFEHLVGSAFNDTLTGNALDNILDGRQGNDTLNGGEGNDMATYLDLSTTSGVTVNLAKAGPQATGGAGTDTLISIESVAGSRFNDILTGNGVHNELFGDRGNDKIAGAGGADFLDGGVGNDTLTGGDGDDFIVGGAGNDTLNGGSGFDFASYATANAGVKVSLTTIGVQGTGGGGSDTLGGIEHLVGSSFNDTLTGNSAGNRLEGGIGRDTLTGNGGNDVLIGGFVRTVGSGLPNPTTDGDTMKGGTGNDTYQVTATSNQAGYGTSGSSTVINVSGYFKPDLVIEAAGGGTDTVEAWVSYTLPANVENLRLLGLSALNGTGNGLGNLVEGNGGGNTLNGLAGNDVLRGLRGADVLTGGTGADKFDFDAITDSSDFARDRVADFKRGEGDKIDLSTIDADTVLGGNNAFTFIGSDPFTAAGQLRFDSTSRLLFGNINADLNADFSILISGTGGMQQSDFIL